MKRVVKPADLYRAPAEPEVVDVPPMLFLMVDGQGDPNTASEYREAIEALFGMSYGLKFALKKERGLQYTVSPLEGLWWSPDVESFAVGAKADWWWTAMIRQPDEVSQQDFERRRADVQRKKPSHAIETIRLQRMHEGTAAQMMHIGPYSTEGPNIAMLHAFIHAQGGTFDGRRQKHHEIYLGDPRRAAPEKLRTLIRQPFTPAR